MTRFATKSKDIGDEVETTMILEMSEAVQKVHPLPYFPKLKHQSGDLQFRLKHVRRRCHRSKSRKCFDYGYDLLFNNDADRTTVRTF